MNAVERLRAVLCAPDGSVVIDGSDGDRATIADALTELEAALTREAPTEAVVAIPEILFDGYAVYEELTAGAKVSMRADDVSDVLDAIVRIMRKSTPPAPQRMAQGEDWLDRLVEVVGRAESKQTGAAAMYLARMAHESNAGELDFTMRGVSTSGEEFGDWQVIVRQATQPPHQDRGELSARLLLEARMLIVVHGRTDESSDVRVMREAAAALTEAKQQGPGEAVDAARWRALVGCARIRVLGSAGLTKDQPNNYAHLGLELWTHHEAGNEGPAVEWLTKFADKARLVQAPQVEAKRQTGEGDAEDAARWRALLGCARIRILGSAGLMKEQPNGYAHIGLELWTHHTAGHEGPTEWLTMFADKARIAAAAKPSGEVDRG